MTLMSVTKTNELEGRFLGAQLVSRKPYEFSRTVLYRVYPGGRRDVTISLKTLELVTATSFADLIITDAAGNIISDTRQERLQRRDRFAELAAKYHQSDTTASGILCSFDTAVRDPDNELVHLYEIRDALSRRFGGDRAAKQELVISNSRWSELGRLANAEPIRQGRHRGEYVGALRDATPDELNEVQSIAVQMIEAYLEYLERNSP